MFQWKLTFVTWLNISAHVTTRTTPLNTVSREIIFFFAFAKLTWRDLFRSTINLTEPNANNPPWFCYGNANSIRPAKFPYYSKNVKEMKKRLFTKVLNIIKTSTRRNRIAMHCYHIAILFMRFFFSTILLNESS